MVSTIINLLGSIVSKILPLLIAFKAGKDTKKLDNLEQENESVSKTKNHRLLLSSLSRDERRRLREERSSKR